MAYRREDEQVTTLFGQKLNSELRQTYSGSGLKASTGGEATGDSSANEGTTIYTFMRKRKHNENAYQFYKVKVKQVIKCTLPPDCARDAARSFLNSAWYFIIVKE